MNVYVSLKFNKYFGYINLDNYQSYFSTNKPKISKIFAIKKYKVFLIEKQNKKIRIFLDEHNYKILIEYFQQKYLLTPPPPRKAGQS